MTTAAAVGAAGLAVGWRRAPRQDEAQRVSEALSPGVMGPRLRAALGSGGDRPCHVLDAKYEPGRRCSILYQLGTQLVRGDLVVGEAIPGASPRGWGTVPGLRLSVFPHDPDMPTLAAVADAARLTVALRAADLVDDVRVLDCRTTLLRYRPGRRATFQVTVRPGAGSGPGRAPEYVAKVYHDPGKAAAVAAEAAALEAGIDSAGGLGLAPVAGYLPHLSVVLQRRVPGRGLDQLIGSVGRGGDREAPSQVRRAAGALAALHRQRPSVSGRHRAVERELERFAARASRIAVVDAEAGSLLGQGAARLADCSRTVLGGTDALVHGDCKPSQFLIGPARVTLIDLDHCGRADPATDVGTFLATLRQQAVRGDLAGGAAGRAAGLAQLSELFLSSYLAFSGASDMRPRIRWYEAVALERKALRAFARAPRSPLPAVLAREVHRCLDRWLEEYP